MATHQISQHSYNINFGEQNYSYNIPIGEDELTAVSASAKVSAVPILFGLRWEFGLPIGPKLHIGAQAGVHNFTFQYEGSAVEQGVVTPDQRHGAHQRADEEGGSHGSLSWSWVSYHGGGRVTMRPGG